VVVAMSRAWSARLQTSITDSGQPAGAAVHSSLIRDILALRGCTIERFVE
jgi:hypothetical protein